MKVHIRDQIAEELAGRGAPPMGTLVDDALVAGRRLRRRRRWAVAASAAASFVAVASAGLVVASGLAGGGAPATVQAGEPGKSSEPPAAAAPEIPPGHALTSGAAVVVLLRELVPGGGVSEVDHGTDTGSAFGSFVFDDGQGAATVSAGVANRPAHYGPSVTGMLCPPDEDGLVCEHTVNPDGSEVRVMTVGPYGGDCSDDKCSISDLRVELKRPDGVYITVDAYNGPFGRNRGATREATVLDVAQLTAIAEDPRWGLTMESSFVTAAESTVLSLQ